MNRIEKSFEIAKEIYAEHGVDVMDAMEKLERIAVSIHAWQGDDVKGFELAEHAMTGGCQVTGNYPGRARTADELRKDLDLSLKLTPGRHKVCLQAHQVDKVIPGVDRDAYTLEHFSSWLDWASAKGMGLDIAPAFYSHPKLEHGLSLSHPDMGIRRFWIDHGKSCRRIGEEFGKRLGTPCVCNFWAPDGFKDTPVDRLSPRLRLAESLDAIFAEKIDERHLLDALESKLFGIGTESFTVASHEFSMIYATRRKILVCLDSGHFHPTESIADKISGITSLQGRILLHVSRGVHWDSDHVVVVNDELLGIARECVRSANADNLHICLDYFDASINRIAAWVIGARNVRKVLLIALLEPVDEMMRAEKTWDFTGRLALQEAGKELPWQSVWDYFCMRHDVPQGAEFMREIMKYEKAVFLNR